MAYVNGTTHYNLPQTVGTDKRDWADTNEAFAVVDAALYSTTEDVANAQTEINGLKERMTTAEENITDNASDISALDGRLTTAEGTITKHTAQIADVRQDTEDMICAYNEASATSTHAYAVGDYFIYNDVLYRATALIGVGDTIVPDTNCTTTNVTTELTNRDAKVIATFTSDGTHTWGNMVSALLDRVLTDYIDLILIREEANSDNTYFTLAERSETINRFSTMTGSSANISAITITHTYNGNYASIVAFNINGTFTFTDLSSTLISNGTRFVLIGKSL